MKQETSQWGKAVKKAVIDHDMTLKQLAEKIGYSNAAVSQVVNGRYSNSSYKVIAEKINEVLGTEGLPERTETPSDEWCQTVKVLSKWGILSVDMQRAIQDDQKVYDEDGEGSYGDNQPDIVEAQDPFSNIEQKEEEQQIGGLDLEEVE